MQVVRDFFERKTVRRTEREDQRVVERGGLQLEVELPAEALAQRQAPGAHHARAERRVYHQMRVADFIEEALEDDLVARRQQAARGSRAAVVCCECGGPAAVQIDFGFPPLHASPYTLTNNS